MRSIVITIGLMLLGNLAYATPFSVSDQQALTSRGQELDFNFTGVPTSGSDGQFSITLNGDYSFSNSESAVVSIDVAGGILDIGNGTNGVISNTIAGLTVNTFNTTFFSNNDQELSWIFDMTDLLLSSIIGDGLITVSVNNDSAVNVFNETNPDFVAVGFSYNVLEPDGTGTGTYPVPEPATLALFGLGLAGLGFARRKKA